VTGDFQGNFLRGLQVLNPLRQPLC
jgi:hypothetical protein